MGLEDLYLLYWIAGIVIVGGLILTMINVRKQKKIRQQRLEELNRKMTQFVKEEGQKDQNGDSAKE